MGNKSGNIGTFQYFAAWAGAVGFPAFFVTLYLIGTLRQGYSPISQFGSDLGLGWPGAWLFNFALAVYGITLMIFALGYYPTLEPFLTRRRFVAVSIIIVLAGVGGLTAATFSESVPALHALGAFLIFTLPTVGQALIGSKKARLTPGFEWYAKYSYVNGILGIVLNLIATFHDVLTAVPALAPIAVALDTQYTGIYQRIEMIVVWNWFPVSAFRQIFLHVRTKDGSDSSPRQ